ncbi:multidrug efflux SMR transporter [Bdellovibrio sp. 22V]|uniref:DMT family transporter n=1 Tax=Bdellovibrio TaxID=958 RepID=UPI0025431D45|nr:multidrug efflux SMR transporter [Bdellovibrio sp. 22V]WII70823.1 multidrug efflux SMR transporter [Bdellovibrio sp. 22V]
MAYVYLAAAIIFEVVGTITMKYSEGFTKVIPVILTLVCHGICFVALAVALKSLPISMVYAIWAGVGTAIMAFIGMMMFNEPLPLQKVLATTLIIVGVVMLNFADKEKPAEQLAKVETAKELKEKPAVVVDMRQRNSG